MQEHQVLETIRNLIEPSVAWTKSGLRDDAFYDPGSEAVYSTDMFVEGQHFDLTYFDLEAVGWKCLAATLSDIAAMGGLPQHTLIGLGLPKALNQAYHVAKLYEGMLGLLESFQTLRIKYPSLGMIRGGDTVSAEHLTISITAIGQMPKWHTPCFRHVAQPGDCIVTTGAHGLSRAGLYALQNKLSGYSAAKEAHLKPMPRLSEGLHLSGHLSRCALMDSSDGLADAVLQMSQQSGVRFELFEEKLGRHPDLVALAERAGVDPLDWILYGGEDFKLVAALSPDFARTLERPFHIIGRVSGKQDTSVDQAEAVLLSEKTGEIIQRLEHHATYQHFPEAT